MLLTCAPLLAACSDPVPPPPPLDSVQIAKCADALAMLIEAGTIKSISMQHGRIEVEDRLWEALPAGQRRLVMASVSCRIYGSWVPPAGRRVSAFGYRSGKMVELLVGG